MQGIQSEFNRKKKHFNHALRFKNTIFEKNPKIGQLNFITLCHGKKMTIVKNIFENIQNGIFATFNQIATFSICFVWEFSC